MVYPLAEFKNKMEENHHIVSELIRGPKIWLIGVEEELKRIIERRAAQATQNLGYRSGGSVRDNPVTWQMLQDWEDIDMHLLASAILTKVPFWTFDKKLNEVAVKLELALRS